MKRVILIWLSCFFCSGVLFSQTKDINTKDEDSKYSKLVSKVAEVQVSVIGGCVNLGSNQSKNTYVLVDRIKYDKTSDVSKKMNQLLVAKGNYFNFTEEIRVENETLGSLISQIKKRDYFQDKLEGINETGTDKNSFIYILRDFKVDYENDVSDYRIVLSVVDVKKEKVLCNVNTNIDLKNEVVLFGKVKGEVKVVPKYIEKEVEKIVKVGKSNKPKEDHLFSIMPYFSGNILDTGFYKVFKFFHGDGKIYNYGLALQYDKHIYDSLYIGVELTGGYLYTDIEMNKSIFPEDLLTRLVIGANVRPTYILNISEKYSIDFLLGLRLGYLRLLNTNNVMYGGFLGFKFGYFKIEAAYPFPFISVGVIF